MSGTDASAGERGFRFRGVGKTFSRGTAAALRDVSLSLPAGRHTAILGPSGCGKTTALRLLAGLEAPTAGEVLIDGKVASDAAVVHLPPYRRNLSLVFQDLALWPNLTARKNVMLGLSGSRLGRRQTHVRADEAMELCRIADLAHRRPGELSGGQQQRVALARAIAPRPAFLLLDEPFSGLDLVLKAQLVVELAELAARTDATLVLVTHDPAEALGLCRHAVLLADGRLVEEGGLEELAGHSSSELFRVFRTTCAADAVAGTSPHNGSADVGD